VDGDHVTRQVEVDPGYKLSLHRQILPPLQDPGSSLDLIREEITIMKMLDHPNVVSLVEVLDDPTDDWLYMVMEMCRKGVVIKVGMSEKADPYDPERCRLLLRDLILGIEYSKTSIEWA
jgi:[calcium/calmodulin-dependent protein kinase] kinase